MTNYQEIVNLNVGGTKFATSWHTLTWVPDTFFTALLSGRIPTVRDETGSIFIDRDPNLFGLILNFLRTRDIDLNNVNIRALRHECDYFGITPLSRRLALCDEMNHSSCGDVLFYGYLPPPLPSCGPDNVSANATSFTTVVVLWGDIPAKDQNCLIKVCYAAISPPQGPIIEKLNASPYPPTKLTELRKYVVYQIQVLGYTRLGDGALSDPPVKVQTFDDTPGPPSNVSFPDVTFTTARIIWDVPEDPNGEILAYRVSYHLNSST